VAVLIRFRCCTVCMYPDDHPPPHFHIRMKDGRELLVAIQRLAVVAGNVPLREVDEAMAWARENRLLLKGKWREMNS